MHRPPERRSVYVITGLALLVILLFGTAALWTASNAARRQIDDMAAANANSTQWSLAQSEVELLTLLTAMHEVAAAPEDARPALLSQVRRRFDIFYSRIVTVEQSPSFDELRQMPLAVEALAQAQAYLDRTAPLIDGDDAALLASLPGLIAEATALRPNLRAVALEGVRVFAASSDQEGGQLDEALAYLALVVGLLFVAMLAAVAVLAALFRDSVRQAARIEATRAHMQTVLGTSIDAIIVTGPDGRIRDFNEVAARMWNMSEQQAKGFPLWELVVPDERQQALQRLITRMQDEPIRIELMQSLARRRSGELFPVEASLASTAGHDGPVLVVFVRDISRRLAEQAALVSARDAAVAGERAKAQMLAIMSHEMRTPLNGVLGTLDLLKTTPLDSAQSRYIEVMEHSGRLLLTHVNDVLDISRADAGRMTLASEMFDPGRIAAQVVGALESEAARRSNNLTLRVIGARSALPIGDPGRVSQILMNLVGNALKFTSGGSVRVEVDRSLGTGTLEFRVIDTGIGIAAADLGRIFDEFVTLDSSYNRVVEGSGLGLGIVRRLVALMGGDLAVESAPGTGSIFRVRLHLPEQRPEDALTAAPATARGVAPRPAAGVVEAAGSVLLRPLDVLLVEDNATNRLIAREMLRRRGCDVTEAADGTEGVEAAETRRFDLILMDISMPRLDGVGATKLIREGSLNAATPIVALTAHALPDQLESFRQAGMDDVLTKPLALKQLDDLLARFGNIATPEPAPALPAPPPEPGPAEALNAARQALAETLGPATAETVLQRLLGDLEAGLSQMAEMADETTRLEELARLAHRLAGSAAVAGLSHMHRLLIELEADARGAEAGRETSDRLHRQIAALSTLMPQTASRQDQLV